MKAITDRIKEPSTWAGISGLLMANTLLLGDEYRAALGIGALVCGTIAILVKDPGHAA